MRQLFASIIFTVCLQTYGNAQEKLTIHFDYNKSELTASGLQTLDSFLKLKPHIDVSAGVHLSGHCDPRGSSEYNINLSKARIESVTSYLQKNGVGNLIQSQLAAGEAQPLNSNRDEAEMAANRRVEITFTKVKPVVAAKPQEKKTLTEQIKDTATKVGGKFVLKNLHFEGGRHVLLPYSVPVLEDLLKTLKEIPTLHIAIEGHVCCAQGTRDGLDIDTRTYDLSVNRARVVYQYLIKNGIDPSRLSWDGYGNRYPLVYPEVTEEERTMNRRVEIKIVKK
jgi:outer membrane protein OmpA-like peptidoglycan-associated protein